MLKLTNVYAGYGGVDIIKNISFDVAENLAVVGPNGCGKTTLLKVIANILAYSGNIEIFDKPSSKMSRQEISLNVAMLSQQPNIYFSYSVFDTVMMGRYLHIKSRFSGSPNSADKTAVLTALAAVGMLSQKDKNILHLSGGQLQRVFLARALAQQPKIILLDEPTNHLDLKCQLDIIDYLKEWSNASNGENRIVIGVLHDINLAMRLSNRLIIMNNGEILANDTSENIVLRGILNDVYKIDVSKYMQESFGVWVR
ncbi:MAG: ABC transporter ATP-binding protein [Defluviitaleaceae bacterium]|nr:ABC transporter ATP-binding protein [Defluviitaleaceae bacterium]